MYQINHCPACFSSNIRKEPALISQFVAWMTAQDGKFPFNPSKTHSINCNECGFITTADRLILEEENLLFSSYGLEDYNNKRVFCEPWYREYLEQFNPSVYYTLKKNALDHLVDAHIDRLTINTVLEYGDASGRSIPKAFLKAKRYSWGQKPKDRDESIVAFNPTLHVKPLMDLVLCTDILSYISNPDSVVNEIKKVIGPHTWVYFEVPNSEDQVLVQSFHEHINLWKKQSIELFVRRHGFEITEGVVSDQVIGVLGKLKQ